MKLVISHLQAKLDECLPAIREAKEQLEQKKFEANNIKKRIDDLMDLKVDLEVAIEKIKEIQPRNRGDIVL